MNPDVSIKSLTGLSGGYQSKDCLQLDNALKDCGDGFVLDSSTNFCYKTLDLIGTQDFGIRSCSSSLAKLLEFESDAQVNGFLNLLKTGENHSLKKYIK